MRFPRVRPGSLAVVLVLVTAGLLFATSAGVARGTDLRSDGPDLSGLIRSQADRVEERTARVQQLREEVETLTAAVAEHNGAVQAVQASPEVVAAAGRQPVTGPGIVITLDDAPDKTLRDGMLPDDLVVHQQDLQAFVNALWAGGAEAMMIQDQRIISTSAVRCVGSTLRLQGRVYSPPYTVTAVGDVEAMRRSLSSAPLVAEYLWAAERFGLGYSEETYDRLELPAYDGGLELRYAQVPDPAMKEA